MTTDAVDVVTSEIIESIVRGSERITLTRHGHAIAAIVSMEDLERLQKLDANAADRERAHRRGLKWEKWEDELMLDDDLDDVDIAIQTQRTVKSVREHRRWIRQIAEARGER